MGRRRGCFNERRFFRIHAEIAGDFHRDGQRHGSVLRRGDRKNGDRDGAEARKATASLFSIDGDVRSVCGRWGTDLHARATPMHFTTAAGSSVNTSARRVDAKPGKSSMARSSLINQRGHLQQNPQAMRAGGTPAVVNLRVELGFEQWSTPQSSQSAGRPALERAGGLGASASQR